MIGDRGFDLRGDVLDLILEEQTLLCNTLKTKKRSCENCEFHFKRR